MLLLPLLACSPSAPSPDGKATDTGATPLSAGVVVLVGGGSEGEVGDASAWSADLYRALLVGGDVTGDGRVTVAILASEAQDEWLPGYFEWLGADDAFNVTAGSRERADAVAETVAAADAVFLKGGDQGVYYDTWNDTALEAAIRAVGEAGGGIGGTSAGAMSQAGYALAGGQDLISRDVLEDAQTLYLDDTAGGSSLHDDFLGTLPGVVIDTHFTTRGRLGRLAGTLAKVVDDAAPAALLGIGIEEQTGLVVADGVATVHGVGAVSFLVPGDAAPTREAGRPLVWSDLAFDRLTHGGAYDLDSLEVVATGGAPVAWDGSAGAAEGEWYADGDWSPHEERFAVVVTRAPDAYAARAGTDVPVLADAIGIVDAHDSDRRGANEEALFRALYDHVGATGFLVGHGGSMQRTAEAPERVRFLDNPEANGAPIATIVVDTTGVTARSMSASPSVADAGDGSLHAVGLVGMRLHILYTPVGTGLVYDTVRRSVVQP